jgi:hypothetical protein
MRLLTWGILGDRDDVPGWVKDDTELQRKVWEVIAKELEGAEPGCVGRMLACA